jgi:hypothetical protein
MRFPSPSSQRKLESRVRKTETEIEIESKGADPWSHATHHSSFRIHHLPLQWSLPLLRVSEQRIHGENQQQENYA